MRYDRRSRIRLEITNSAVLAYCLLGQSRFQQGRITVLAFSVRTRKIIQTIQNIQTIQTSKQFRGVGLLFVFRGVGLLSVGTVSISTGDITNGIHGVNSNTKF
jgi:hypothetical protein